MKKIKFLLSGMRVDIRHTASCVNDGEEVMDVTQLPQEILNELNKINKQNNK